MLNRVVHHRTTFFMENFMNKLASALVLAGLATVATSVVAADAPASPHTVSFNVGLTTDYIFRGISQSQHSGAISGGADYSHASGAYAGIWASTQKWVETAPYKNDSSLEIDLYGGYKGSMGDIGYDLGLIRYYYPGDKVAGAVSPDTTEIYVGASWKMLSFKYSYAISDYFISWGTLGTVKTRGSNYLELNATHDLGDGWGLLGHIGHQKVKNWSAADYTDYKIGVTKDVGFGTVTLAYSDTDADAAGQYTWAGKDVSKGVVALSFSKAF